MMSTLTIALSLILSYHISSASPALAQPSISVPSLTAELVSDGLSSPTSIAFLDENNILVLEKEGSVRLISNGQLQPEPVLELDGVVSHNERGLLGIEIMDDKVFLYATYDVIYDVRNRIHSFTWDGTSLTNPQLVADLPAGPGTSHQGGKLKIGPDNQLYVTVGEMHREGQLQNLQNGPAPDDTGVILRVNPEDGSPSSGNPFSNDPANPLSKYYAYGIRNSFGIEFDPVSGKLWETENGEDVFDEINLVQPGFNSGWMQVMGPIAANTSVSNSSLVNMPGAQYADPVFSWSQARGVTDIEFFNSSAFGPNYENGIFVGDITTGTLFYFEPNANRTGISLESDPLSSDLVADSEDEISSVTFGTGFSGITDIETGPDGNLYILEGSLTMGLEGSKAHSQGSLYRIMPAGESGDASLIQSVNVQGNLHFADEFNGNSLNSTKWNTQNATDGIRWCSISPVPELAVEHQHDGLGQWLDASSEECNGVMQSPPYGNITVRNGSASFSSPELNRAFPYIWNGPSSLLPNLSSPFPDSGDFVFEIRMKYNKISPFVGGVVILEKTDSNPAGNNPPFGPKQGVGIWAGPDGPRVDWKDQIFRSSSMFNSTNFHQYRLEYTNGSYSLYVDDVLMKQPTPSNTRPNTIWIGNPVVHHWGEDDWTAFEIDYIRTYSLDRTNMSAVH